MPAHLQSHYYSEQRTGEMVEGAILWDGVEVGWVEGVKLSGTARFSPNSCSTSFSSSLSGVKDTLLSEDP